MDWPYNKTLKVPQVLYFHLLTSTTSRLGAPIALRYPSSVNLIEDFDFALPITLAEGELADGEHEVILC